MPSRSSLYVQTVAQEAIFSLRNIIAHASSHTKHVIPYEQQYALDAYR